MIRHMNANTKHLCRRLTLQFEELLEDRVYTKECIIANMKGYFACLLEDRHRDLSEEEYDYVMEYFKGLLNNL